MNPALLRKIDRWVGVPLCRLLSLWPRRQSILPVQPSALVVILLSEMGSLVLAVPMLQRLRVDYPHTRLYALVFATNREILDLLGIIAPEDIFTIRDTSLGQFIQDSLRAIWQLRCIKPAGIIDCELFARVSSLFARLSGALVHVGFHPHTQEGLYRGSFITNPVLYNPYLHISHQYLNLATALTSTSQPKGKRVIKTDLTPAPPIVFPESEINAFFHRLYKNHPAISNKRLVLLYPSGGALPIRAWPHASYLTLSRALLEDGFALGIIGLPSDQMQAQALVTECASPWCINLAGYTQNIRELLLLFQRAALLVTNDGGPGQFAAITKMPSIVLFGPETPLLYRPLGANVHSLFAQVSCAPCLTAYNHRNTPCDGDNRCLQAITPEEVLVQARDLLTEMEQ